MTTLRIGKLNRKPATVRAGIVYILLVMLVLTATGWYVDRHIVMWDVPGQPGTTTIEQTCISWDDSEKGAAFCYMPALEF